MHLLHIVRLTFRILSRQIGFTVITMIGLVVGMTTALIIFLWVHSELMTNKIHTNAENIYLVRTTSTRGEDTRITNDTPPALGPAIESEQPEIINMCRIPNWNPQFIVKSDSIYTREIFMFSDPDIFRMFAFDFLYVSEDLLYEGPDIIVLNQRVSLKIFGDANPVGNILRLENKYDVLVAGVIKQPATNTTISFDCWLPLDITKKINSPGYLDTWYNQSFQTYVQVYPEANIATLKANIFNRIERSMPGSKVTCSLYPFKDLYLKLYGNLGITISMSIIAFLVLSLVCINYTNLISVRSHLRLKEIYIKKVFGARRITLLFQLLFESLVLSVFSLFLSFIFVELLLPVINRLFSINLSLMYFRDINFFSVLLLIIIAMVLFSVWHPSMLLAETRYSIFKPDNRLLLRGRPIRKYLSITQFSISMIMILVAVFMYKQVKHISRLDMGIRTDHLIYINLEGIAREKPWLLKQELNKESVPYNITLMNAMPTGIYWNGEGWNWHNKDMNIDPLVTYIYSDQDFTNTFNVEIISGRNLQKDFPFGVLVNEEMARIIGPDFETGMQLYTKNSPREVYTILGVVKNFYFKPLHREIEPLIIFNNNRFEKFNHCVIQLMEGNERLQLANISNIYKKVNPEFPFEPKYLEDDYRYLYSGFRKMNSLLGFFAFLGIFISCFGLFSLVLQMTEYQTKEIGIRKVNGASRLQILKFLLSPYIVWILISFIIAVPISNLVILSWLKNFASRISISWPIILATGFFIFLIAMLTIVFQGIIASRKNPVEALRYE